MKNAASVRDSLGAVAVRRLRSCASLQGFCLLAAAAFSSLAFGATPADPPHPVMAWVKRHPRPGAPGTPSPRMGYETSYGYDPATQLLIRYGGHNQGGGGEQNSEVWTYDLDGDAWMLMEPNNEPPGVCCAQQNVFDDACGKLIRFPAFSGSHGWQSFREIYLTNSSVWTYDLPANTWRYLRPNPEVWPSPLRGAAYDPHHQVTVLHGGENSGHGTVVYDLHANAWHTMKPRPAPEPNFSQPGFTYDAANRLFVLFGSQFQEDERTWLYDLRKNAWRVLEAKEHPPGKRASPVLAADTRNGIVLCVVQRGGEKDPTLETWALDVAKATWTHLKLEREPDPSGNRNRVLLYLPDRNLFVLENRTRDEQQIWTFRYAEAPPPLPRIRDFKVVAETNRVKLSWKPLPGGADVRYRVLRGEGQKPWEVTLGPIAQAAPDTDVTAQKGTLYYYQVRAETREGKECGESFIVRAQPPIVAELTVSVLGPKKVSLEWKRPDAEDIVGYHVERAEVSVYSIGQVLRIKQRYRRPTDLAVGRIKRIGQFQRLTPKPLDATSYVDETVDLAAGQKEPPEPWSGGSPLRAQDLDPTGKTYRYAVYAYRVFAVNALGVESGPSPFLFTYPSAVQHVGSKEVGGEATTLKWARNLEKGIKGYLVYRHDSRWDKDPITLLTPEPLDATEFTDEASGRATRRYEIVAVDALGQEGEPSRAVWSRREWRAFYVPYVKGWHQ